MGCILLELLYPELFAEDDVAAKDGIKLRQKNREKLIEYNPEYHRLNSLIEGCTLDDWNQRWGREQIEKWQRGGNPPIVYRSTSMQANEWKLTRDKVVRSVDEFVDHSLSLTPDEFYSDLIEDQTTYNKMRTWLGDLLSSEDSRHIETIRNKQGLKGKYQIRESIIRYLAPGLPLICEGQSFELATGDHYAAVRDYLIRTCDCLKSFNPIIAAQYVFQLEFALKQLLRTAKDDDPEIAQYAHILNIMSLIMENADTGSTPSDQDGSVKQGRRSFSAEQLLETTCDYQPDERLLNLRLKLLGFIFEQHIDSIKSSTLSELKITIRQSIAERNLYQDIIQMMVSDESSDNLVCWSQKFLTKTQIDLYGYLLAIRAISDESLQSSLLELFWTDLDDSKPRLCDRLKVMVEEQKTQVRNNLSAITDGVEALSRLAELDEDSTDLLQYAESLEDIIEEIDSLLNTDNYVELLDIKNRSMEVLESAVRSLRNKKQGYDNKIDSIEKDIDTRKQLKISLAHDNLPLDTAAYIAIPASLVGCVWKCSSQMDQGVPGLLEWIGKSIGVGLLVGILVWAGICFISFIWTQIAVSIASNYDEPDSRAEIRHLNECINIIEQISINTESSKKSGLNMNNSKAKTGLKIQ
jgi:hypothetical protein